MLESAIQKSVVKWAREHGVVAIKLTTHGVGAAGWPDYLFLYAGAALFIEFKAPGNTLTERQAFRHKQLAEVRHRAFTCDNVSEGQALIVKHLGVRT